LSNGAFSKSGVAASAFTLQDVKDGLVLFTHSGSDAAPAYSVALSSAGVTTAAKAAFVAFATGGTDGADALSGTSAADLLIGMGGDDLIMGGAGNDILYGHGTGAIGSATDNDVFKWAAGDAGAGAIDVIRDFAVWNGTSGDKLDISGLLQGFQGSGQSLDKWVTIQDNVTPPTLLGWDATRSGALITIDLDGAGSGTVTQSIFLEGVSLGSGNVNTPLSTGVIIA
jgi:Ca2+-binding RTX toxin-like protein